MSIGKSMAPVRDSMKHIVVINPNTSVETTAMMTDLVREALQTLPFSTMGPASAGITVEGLTAVRGVPMICDPQALDASVAGVVAMGRAAAARADGIIVCAFGDPGLEALRGELDIPVVGICEASMLEAAAGGRRFGIATVTPDLVASFGEKAAQLGLSAQYAGTRLTAGDPVTLAGDPARLTAALATAVRQSLTLDRADVVIIGGGPLGKAAAALQQALLAPVIAPISSAVADVLARLALAEVGTHS
jgi:Asp/Glu/hydantoin racemase